MTNDELSYLIVRSLTEGEVIETIEPVDRDMIDDMADADRQIILNFLEKYRPTAEVERLQASNAALLAAASGLVAYRDRVGPLYFQLEKADDYIERLRAAIAQAETVN